MKPDWNDAPEWANYVAMDKNGDWFWYEYEPLLTPGSHGFYVHTGKNGRVEKKNWQESLQKRPR